MSDAESVPVSGRDLAAAESRVKALVAGEAVGEGPAGSISGGGVLV